MKNHLKLIESRSLTTAKWIRLETRSLKKQNFDQGFEQLPPKQVKLPNRRILPDMEWSTLEWYPCR